MILMMMMMMLFAFIVCPEQRARFLLHFFLFPFVSVVSVWIFMFVWTIEDGKRKRRKRKSFQLYVFCIFFFVAALRYTWCLLSRSSNENGVISYIGPPSNISTHLSAIKAKQWQYIHTHWATATTIMIPKYRQWILGNRCASCTKKHFILSRDVRKTFCCTTEKKNSNFFSLPVHFSRDLLW